MTQYAKFRSSQAWRDELGDILLLQQQGPGVSTNATEAVVEFTTASNLSDYLYLNIQLNHDKDLACGLYPHIHFFQDQNNVPNFLLQYRWQVNGAAKTTSWTSVVCNTPVFAYSAGTIHQIAYAAPIAVPVGSTLSDIVQFRILRDNADTSALFKMADPFTGTVGLLSFDVHFRIDTLGSISEYAK